MTHSAVHSLVNQKIIKEIFEIQHFYGKYPLFSTRGVITILFRSIKCIADISMLEVLI